MRFPLRTRSILAHARLVALVLSLAAPAALAECPASTLRFPSLGPLTTTEPTFDVTSGDGSWIVGDHRAGDYSLHHIGTLSPTVVTARDRFDVIEVPAGTPVDVLLVFEITGWTYTAGCGGTGCCGFVNATIRAGGADSTVVSLIGHTFNGYAYFSGAAALPLSLVAGTPRDLEVEMYARRCAGGSHTVDAKGHVRFVGTDEAAQIVSCKGFGPVLVPVRRTSWGELKTIYR